jgi:hypothetical protein
MHRYRFGGSEFINCSVPLVLVGRCFVVEPGDPIPLVSVILEHQGQPVFEVLRNEPKENPVSEVSRTPRGFVTVVDRATGHFLYKVRPDSETSIVFSKGIRGEEVSAVVTDRVIRVGGVTVKNCIFGGVGAGIVVDESGRINVAGPIPPAVLRLLEKREG